MRSTTSLEETSIFDDDEKFGDITRSFEIARCELGSIFMEKGGGGGSPMHQKGSDFSVNNGN